MQMTSHITSPKVDLMVQSGEDRVQQEAARVKPSHWSLVCDQFSTYLEAGMYTQLPFY